MNKLFSAVALSVIVLAGGGCAASNIVTSIIGEETVQGPWRLAFDLPEGWAMVKEYDEPTTSAIAPDPNVTRDLQTVIVQSTNKVILQGARPDVSLVSEDTYVIADYSLIRIDRLDERRVIPRDAEDLGDGFAVSEGKYYFTAESGEKFQFTITSDDNDLTDEIAVIRSAKLVTEFTDTPAAPTAEVQTNE